MAARSFSITVNNWTGKVWKRTALGLSHGVWSDNESLVPPEQLPKVSLNDNGDAQPGVIYFESESQGVMTGTEGFVDYANDGNTIHIYWDNPYIGSNSFSVAVPDAYAASFTDYHGNNADVTVDIRHH